MTTPREAKSLAVTVCRFQRWDPLVDRKGPWETGIAVLPWAGTRAGTSDVSTIVDLDGKPVRHIYNYQLCHSQGCFTASDIDEFSPGAVRCATDSATAQCADPECLEHGKGRYSG